MVEFVKSSYVRKNANGLNLSKLIAMPFNILLLDFIIFKIDIKFCKMIKYFFKTCKYILLLFFKNILIYHKCNLVPKIKLVRGSKGVILVFISYYYNLIFRVIFQLYFRINFNCFFFFWFNI